MSTEKMTLHPESYRAVADEVRRALRENRIVERIRQKDHTLWKPEPKEIANRLGWLDSPRSMWDACPRSRPSSTASGPTAIPSPSSWGWGVQPGAGGVPEDLRRGRWLP